MPAGRAPPAPMARDASPPVPRAAARRAPAFDRTGGPRARRGDRRRRCRGRRRARAHSGVRRRGGRRRCRARRRREGRRHDIREAIAVAGAAAAVRRSHRDVDRSRAGRRGREDLDGRDHREALRGPWAEEHFARAFERAADDRHTRARFPRFDCHVRDARRHGPDHHDACRRRGGPARGHGDEQCREGGGAETRARGAHDRGSIVSEYVFASPDSSVVSR